jgi:alpha-glucosidase
MTGNHIKLLLLIALQAIVLQGCTNEPENNWRLSSPGNLLALEVRLDDEGSLSYSLGNDGNSVLESSPLGIRFEETEFGKNLSVVSSERISNLRDSYELLIGKRKKNEALWNELQLSLENEEGRSVRIIFRLFDEGLAFRYVFEEPGGDYYTLAEELTGFRIPRGSYAWMHPYAAVTQWSPAYETYYENRIPAGTPSPEDQNGWAFPMLFHTGTDWMLITDADLREGYVGMSVNGNPEGGLYTLKLPSEEEALGVCPSQPTLSLPFKTPWRVVIAGSDPGVIVESNLVYHVSTPNVLSDTSWIITGRAGWSWWTDNTSPTNYKRLREFIDFTAEMGWEYFLVDANWNEMKGGNIVELTRYASSIGVDIALWYNSGGPHNVVTEAPRDLMHIPEIRREEFRKISEWGVKGIKVDFFQSDKACILDLYHGILLDAADFNITVNFHGSTIPRGWERTYPNLLTMESVRATESYLYDANYPARAPVHNTILPFTRNVIGPMDFTPVPFSDVRYPKKTTHAHELATAVVFESGLLHFADDDNSYRAQPGYVIEYLKKVPATWDDTRFVDGYPGEWVSIARRKGDTWYMSGIHGFDDRKTVNLKMDFLSESGYVVELISDGESPRSFNFETRSINAGDELTVEMLPKGGFAAVITRK